MFVRVRPLLLIGSLCAVVLTAEPLGAASADVGPRLLAETLAAWDRYVSATEGRRQQELSGGPFLLLDRAPDAASARRRLVAGDVVVEPAAGEIEVPSARVHHWRGAVFIPDTTVRAVLTRLRQGPPPQKDVLRAAVLERSPGGMTVALRIRRTKIVTIVYDTEHDVTFTSFGDTRAASATKATRIVEIENPGTPNERPLAPGEDHGFLWRLNAYWRYEQVPGGVIAECESISLSRDVPFGLGPIAGPIINSTARDSMEAALRAVRAIGDK